MKKETIVSDLQDVLPDNTPSPSLSAPSRDDAVADVAHDIKARCDAKALAAIKFREKKALEREKKRAAIEAQKRRAIADELGVAQSDLPEGMYPSEAKRVVERRKRVETIEAIEAACGNVLSPDNVASALAPTTSPKEVASIVSRASALTTSRPEILKLMAQLNINLNVQLTKTDTANLLACLLTCNETQLDALYNNMKVPVAIRTVIKRIQDDAALGNIETIEKLWDRVFGKGSMCLNLPEEQQVRTGIIPDTPVSREAYIVIRDTLIK